jgi:WD repeat-containing protein 48
MRTHDTVLTTKQMLPNTMTLSTLRAHVWKGGNDIMLYYKGNGRKEIPFPPPPPPPVVEPEESEEAQPLGQAAQQPTAVAA